MTYTVRSPRWTHPFSVFHLTRMLKATRAGRPSPSHGSKSIVRRSNPLDLHGIMYGSGSIHGHCWENRAREARHCNLKGPLCTMRHQHLHVQRHVH